MVTFLKTHFHAAPDKLNEAVEHKRIKRIRYARPTKFSAVRRHRPGFEYPSIGIAAVRRDYEAQSRPIGLVRVQQLLETILPIDWHQQVSLLFGRRVRSEMARFGMSGSVASRSSAGSTPTVDSVMRRPDMANPCSSASILSDFIVAS
jgi:hypothetical protein